MNTLCKTIRDQFSDYLDRSLSFGDRERFDSHLLTCKPCRSALEMTREMISACHRMEETTVPIGFTVTWRERIGSASPVKVSSPLGWFKKVSPALRPAAVWGTVGLALLILATTLYRLGPPQADHSGAPSKPSVASSPAVVQPVRLDLHQDHLLRIWFDARQPIEEVRFYLELPEGIAMVENGQIIQTHRFEWVGDLKEGRNLIPVPVRGVAKGQWRVTAWIEKGSTRKEKSIEVWVSGA